jgi:hypothetical protein
MRRNNNIASSIRKRYVLTHLRISFAKNVWAANHHKPDGDGLTGKAIHIGAPVSAGWPERSALVNVAGAPDVERKDSQQQQLLFPTLSFPSPAFL